MSNLLKLREVSEKLGLKSYPNAEYNNHKTMKIEKVHALARIYGLDEAGTSDLVSAWNELPVSEYSQKQRDKWDKRNAARSKAKRHDLVFRALMDTMAIVTGIVFFEDWPDDKAARLCECDKSSGIPAHPCELCNALHVLGLPQGWTNRADVVDRLGALQAELYPEPLPE